MGRRQAYIEVWEIVGCTCCTFLVEACNGSFSVKSKAEVSMCTMRPCTCSCDPGAPLSTFGSTRTHTLTTSALWLYRWYTKRATQFPPGFPAPEDLADAPAMLPSDPGKPPLQSRARTSISGEPFKAGYQ